MKFFKKLFSITIKKDRKVLTILGIKLSFSRFKFQKIYKFKNTKPTIAFQLNEMDKGGLEEVVLHLATNEKIREKYNTVIISDFSNKGYLAKVARAKGVPVYSFFQNSSNIEKLIKKLNIKIVHFHYNISGVEKYKNLGIKTIYTIHSNYIWLNKEEVQERIKYYKLIDNFVAVSMQVKEFFVKKFDVNPAKVQIIPNGIEYIDTSKIEPISRKKSGFKEDDFIFISVGTISSIKYQLSQIAAFSLLINKYPNFKLIIIGNNPNYYSIYYDKLINFIDSVGLKNNVILLSYMPKMKVYSYLKMADVFISTSLTEGFGLAAAEAMMFNKPLILTNIGGAQEFIQNNDIGIIVKHAVSDIDSLSISNIENELIKDKYYFDNDNEIVSAMEDMYLNKENWAKKAKLGNIKIKENFNLNRVCNDYFEKYNKINFEINENNIAKLKPLIDRN